MICFQAAGIFEVEKNTIGKGGNSDILKCSVLCGMRDETTTNEACRRSCFTGGQNVFRSRRWWDLSERKFGTQRLCSWLTVSFREAQEFRRSGKGGNRVRSGKSTGTTIGKGLAGHPGLWWWPRRKGREVWCNRSWKSGSISDGSVGWGRSFMKWGETIRAMDLVHRCVLLVQA